MKNKNMTVNEFLASKINKQGNSPLAYVMKITAEQINAVNKTEIAEELDFLWIVQVVAKEFGTTPKKILAQDRTERTAHARHAVASIWSETHTLSETGELLGKKDHTPIINSRMRVRLLMEESPAFARRMANVVDLILQHKPWILDAN